MDEMPILNTSLKIRFVRCKGLKETLKFEREKPLMRNL